MQKTKMTPQQFVEKWSRIQQNERAIAQTHFNDICRLIGHPTPLEYDPSGRTFSFETGTIKPDGRKGFADVFFRGRFIWEYKGPSRDLDKAYEQLLLYRDTLDNPPLLITSDVHTIHIHTNFTNRPTHKQTITFNDILNGRGLEQLRWAFTDPERFKPERTKEEVTRASADTFIAVADAMKQHQRLTGEAYSPEQLAHFLVRLLFCLFAEDLGLLPKKIFTEIVRVQGGEAYADLTHALRNLFQAMRSGHPFGFYRIPWFNGTLFDDDFVPSVPHDLAKIILRAAEQDWSAVDPSIFGTLFERVIDEEKRAQLGAHYTSQSDILLIVEPVLIAPLRHRWDEVRREVDGLLRQQPGDGNQLSVIGNQSPETDNRPPITDNRIPLTAHHLLSTFAAHLATIRVLDPACGSGNFLYVALRRLLDLQKEVIAYAGRKDLPDIELTVSPQQLYGIEINPYAHELAQITAWIGYLQWRHENGFAEMGEPILQPLNNIRNMDAILAYDDHGRPIEPQWPAADIIIGNPPFLGSRKMRPILGNKYCDALLEIYQERIQGLPDLVCFWFDKANEAIKANQSQRAGLLATQAIRGGANRRVLDRIKNTGDIFLAWSDREWILDGATVHVSIVGFDNGKEISRELDGNKVSTINSDLTSGTDLTTAYRLNENVGISFQGVVLRGPFNISVSQAMQMLAKENEDSNYLNSEVIRPRRTGQDILQRASNEYVIDFGLNTPIEIAQKYSTPYEYIRKFVYPTRQKANQEAAKEKWWLHWNPRVEMRTALLELNRFIATPRVGKHRVFVWLDSSIQPDAQLVVFARQDDYFLGVLHWQGHELWSKRLGTQLRDAESASRYTSTTSFETFPFPWPPGQEPAESADPRVAAIAHWARELVHWRDAWLNPPPPPSNVIDVAYDRLLKVRTLTNLYNGLTYYRDTAKQGRFFDPAQFAKVTRHSVTRPDIIELDDIHTALDAAVLDAYGWPHNLTADQILERLLTLNLERAANA